VTVPRGLPSITLCHADLELKSHKAQVPFLATVSFQLHLSSLISILMGYSCWLAHDSAVVTQTCGNRIYRRLTCVCTRMRVHAHIPRPAKLIQNPRCVPPPLSRIGKRTKAPQTFSDITLGSRPSSFHLRWCGKYCLLTI